MDGCSFLLNSPDAIDTWDPVGAAGHYAEVNGIIAAVVITTGIILFSGRDSDSLSSSQREMGPELKAVFPVLVASVFGTYEYATIAGERYCERAQLLTLVAAWPFAVASLGLVLILYHASARNYRFDQRTPSGFLLMCVMVAVGLAGTGVSLAEIFGISTNTYLLGSLTLAGGLVSGAMGSWIGSSELIPRSIGRGFIAITTAVSLALFGLVMDADIETIRKLADLPLLTAAIWSPTILAPVQCFSIGVLMPERSAKQYGVLF